MPIPSVSLSQSRPVRYVVFFYLYVMQGLPAGLSGTALYNYLIARDVDPAAAGAFAASAGLPWAFQFVWGPVIDRFQGSRMGRRRPWVLGAQLLAVSASLSLLFVTDPVAQMWLLSAAVFVHSLCASVQDAAVDAMAISTIPAAERGRVNGAMRAGFIAGIGGGAAGYALVLGSAGFTAAVLVNSGLLLALTLVTVFVKERPGDALLPWSRGAAPAANPPAAAGPRMSVARIFTESFAGLLSPASLATFGAVVAAYLGANVFYRAYSFHLIRTLGWADTELSVFAGTLGTVVPLVLVLGGGILADRVGQARLLAWVMLGVGGFLFAFSLLSGYWGRPGVASAGLVVWSTFDPLISVASMPLLMGMCRRGVEGSQFTAYMALVNLTDVAGQFLTGLVLDRVPPPAIGAVCGVAVLAAGALTAVRLTWAAAEDGVPAATPQAV